MIYTLQWICNLLYPPIKLLVVATLLAMLVGCEKPVKPLQIGNNAWPGYEPAYLARSLGYLDKLPVRLVEYSSTTQVLAAFQNGLIQSAFLTLDEVILLRSRGFRAQIILVVDESNGADAIVGRPPMSTMQDIKGRRVGVEDSASGAFMLLKVLKAASLQLSDIETVSVEIDQHERAYREGRVDAVVTFEPVRSRLLTQGARVLFGSSQIPGEIIDVLAVDEGAWEEQRDTLLKVAEAWFRASDFLRTQPEDAMRRIGMRLRLDPQALRKSYQGIRLLTIEDNLGMLRGSPSKLDQAAISYWKLMAEHGLLSDVVDVKTGLKDLVDPSVVEAIKAGGAQ